VCRLTAVGPFAAVRGILLFYRLTAPPLFDRIAVVVFQEITICKNYIFTVGVKI
jgi:hypothetical protein